MNRVLVIFACVAIPTCLGVLTSCPAPAKVSTDDVIGDFNVSLTLNADFLSKTCGAIKLEKKDGNIVGTFEFKDEKDTKNTNITLKETTANSGIYKLTVGDNATLYENHEFRFFNAKKDSYNVLIGCKAETNSINVISAVLNKGTLSEADNKVITDALKTTYELDSTTYAKVDHSKDKCSSGVYLIPSILTGIVMILLTKLF